MLGRLLLTAALIIGTSTSTGTGTGTGETPEPMAVASHQIPVTPPPMGWASWNTFAARIDHTVIKQQADALVSSGMAAAGYTYVNIDEGWWQGTRDSSGNITVDTAEWPGGMKAIADYLHSRGLKAGIYTDAGRDGCGYYFPTGRPAAPGSGSEGHYEQDFLAFARWGFDFVKVDWCGGDAEGLTAETQYRQISAAIDSAAVQTGRRLVLSICDWGKQEPWNWGPGVGAMWRTSTDIIFFGEKASMGRVLTALDRSQNPVAQHTGYYNDPDMMTVGMPDFTAAQNRTHMALWAVSGAPMLAGNNLATMSAGTAAILTNREVIAIDQDARGLPGTKVAEDTAGLQVYGKVLSGSGRRAVALLNRTTASATMTVRWNDLGLTGSATVRNVWAAADAGTVAGSYRVTVPANEAVLLTVTGTEAAGVTYQPESGTRFSAIASEGGGLSVAEIEYTNGGSTARTATLAVPGSASTVVAFPPTGSATTPGTVSVVVSLATGNTNTLTFGAGAPDLRAIEVRPFGAPSTAVRITGAASGRCLDVNGNSPANGTAVVLWDCNGQANQQWTPTAAQELRVFGSRCLDAYNNGTVNGTVVTIWDCNGQTNQRWVRNANGTITGVQSGLCLDASGAGTGNGTPIILWTCGTAANQRWTVTPAA